MKALVTYMLLVMGFLLLMHIDPSVSTANPRFDTMLRGKQQTPPPPIPGGSHHQGTPKTPSTQNRPPPPSPLPTPPISGPHFPPLCSPPPPPAY
ncbi:hypothetical protein ABFX02_08G205400 [Erythranthe guttata]